MQEGLKEALIERIGPPFNIPRRVVVENVHSSNLFLSGGLSGEDARECVSSTHQAFTLLGIECGPEFDNETIPLCVDQSLTMMQQTSKIKECIRVCAPD